MCGVIAKASGRRSLFVTGKYLWRFLMSGYNRDACSSSNFLNHPIHLKIIMTSCQEGDLLRAVGRF